MKIAECLAALKKSNQTLHIVGKKNQRTTTKKDYAAV